MDEVQWEESLIRNNYERQEDIHSSSYVGPLVSRYAADVADDLRRCRVFSQGGPDGPKEVIRTIGYDRFTVVGMITLFNIVCKNTTETCPPLPDELKASRLTSALGSKIALEYHLALFISKGDKQKFYLEQTKQRLDEQNTKWGRSKERNFSHLLCQHSPEWVERKHFREIQRMALTLIQSVQAVTPLLDRLVRHRGRKKHQWYLPTEVFKQYVTGASERLLEPVFKPLCTIHPPRPWVSLHDGGYECFSYPFIRTRHHSMVDTHTGANFGNRMRACNILGGVGYRIHPEVFQVAKSLVSNNSAYLPLPQEMDKPPFPEGGTSSDIRAWKDKVRDLHIEQKELQGKARTLDGILANAGQMAKQAAFYLPHSCDTRGRMYPIGSFLTMQGEDLCKGLLQYSEGKPIGEEGAWWLNYCLASAYGLDKATRNQRIGWALDNRDMFLDIAAAPMEHLDTIFQAEEPWVFLQLCCEYLGYAAEGPGYISHAVGMLDATCSGYQHTALLLRDPLTAKLTNLTASRNREDLYIAVAEKMLGLLSTLSIPERRPEHSQADYEMLVAGFLHAKRTLVDAKVLRGLVKRPVMTNQYGVSRRGATSYISKDLIPLFPKDTATGVRYAVAFALSDLLDQAVASTVPSAKIYRKYAEELMAAFIKHDQYPTWTTPDGFKAFKTIPAQRKFTVQSGLHGRIQLSVASRTDDNPPDKRKHVTAFSPDFIHSYDSSHLAGVIELAAAQGASPSAVHDCAGSHMADLGIIQKAANQRYYDMYAGQDHLTRLREELASQLGGDCDLPEAPVLGEWDVSEVLRSKYAFS